MTALEKLVGQVRVKYRELWDRELESASTLDIEAATDYLQVTMGSRLPSELADFWQLADGCGMNGATLYGPEEAVRTTELYIKDYPNYFMVGQYEDAPLFAFETGQRRWVTLEQGDLDRGPRAVCTDFKDVAELVIGLMMGERWSHW